MKRITETRYYTTYDEHGKQRFKKVTYALWFVNEKLQDIRNEYDVAVEKNSEVWDFYSQKYSA